MRINLSKLGPGLLFAGAAIGVSHLVQSTRAGADYGWGLIWALLLINLFKYPFFQYGPRYAQATGETLLAGITNLEKDTYGPIFLSTWEPCLPSKVPSPWLPQVWLPNFSALRTILSSGVSSLLYFAVSFLFWVGSIGWTNSLKSS